MTLLRGEENAPVIVVADDDADLLTLVKLKLQKEGFNIALCHNGVDILSFAEQAKADLILLDVTMDGIDGRLLCKLLKAHKATSSIPIVLFSGNEALDKIAMECGADDFIAKPFQTEPVKRKIIETLSRFRSV